MKIQPVESEAEHIADSEKVVVVRSRLKRLFDRQFHRVLKITENASPAEAEPSSLCLAKMVQNFIEDNNTSDKQPPPSTKCGRIRCNCFKSTISTTSSDSDDVFINQISSSSPPESIDLLKSLVQCQSVAERNLLADASRIFDKNKLHKRKDQEMRRVVVEGLTSLGYDAGISVSRWEKSKSPSHPAGVYEYIDAIVEEEMLVVDIDFRSEFQIARPTGSYKALLQSLPFIFVGRVERLQQIVSIMSEAARLSLKQKGMPFPPWRKAEYMRSKWLASPARSASRSEFVNSDGDLADVDAAAEKKVTPPWSPPLIRAKCLDKDGKVVVTGLASLLKAKP